MADLSQFINFLVMECEDTGSTAFVDALLAQAKAQITAGNGSLGFVQAVAANGKSVNRTQQFTCDEMAYACRQALRLYGNVAGNSPFTFLDFSGASSPPAVQP